MIVMVDAALVERAAHDDRVAYLLELTSEKPVQRHLYADDGPPPEVPRRREPWFDGEAVDDWVFTEPPTGDSGRAAVWCDGKTIFRRELGLRDPRLWPATGLCGFGSRVPPGELEERVGPDVVAVLAAEAIGADIFVTGRTALQSGGAGFRSVTSVLAPEDALPIVGLYLRHQGIFLTTQTPFYVERYSRSTFYWAAARAVLPASWRWMSACWLHSEATGEDALGYVAASAMQRVARALLARDRLHAALSVPQDTETADSVLLELDQVCLWLMGALDATAYVAHFALNVPMKVRNAAWQYKDWLKRVVDLEPRLDGLVSEGSEGQLVIYVLKELRNSIHGEALESVGYEKVGQAPETLVGLSRRARQELMDAMVDLGGREAWGVEELLPNEILVHPGKLVEQLLPRIVALLDAILDATPVDRLSGVDPKSDRLLAPTGRQTLFDARSSLRVRWQLGL